MATVIKQYVKRKLLVVFKISLRFKSSKLTYYLNIENSFYCRRFNVTARTFYKTNCYHLRVVGSK